MDESYDTYVDDEYFDSHDYDDDIDDYTYDDTDDDIDDDTDEVVGPWCMYNSAGLTSLSDLYMGCLLYTSPSPRD